jgi:hypothetical protein
MRGDFQVLQENSLITGSQGAGKFFRFRQVFKWQRYLYLPQRGHTAQGGRSVKLTTHLHLVPRLRKRVATPPESWLDWGLDDRGSIPVRPWDFFHLATVSRLAFGLTHPPIQWIAEVKRPGREADHSPPSSAEAKNAWSYTSTPQYVILAQYFIKKEIRLHGSYSVKHRDNFTFTCLSDLPIFLPA